VLGRVTFAAAGSCAIALFALVLTACGGSSGSSSSGSTTSSQTTAAVPAGSLQELAGAKPIAIVPGTSDYAPGVNRYSFLVVTGNNRLIERPTARVWVSRGLQQKPFEQTTASLVQIATPGDTTIPATNIYVANIKIPSAGKYWVLAKPQGGGDVSALGNMVVGKHTAAPAIGDRAIPSKNPVLRPGVAAKTVTTAEPPDTILLRTTVAAAMAAKRPFVVTFATPLYCQSRTCGPVVQVVKSVAQQWAGKGIDFIHVEIYKDNDPSKGTNQWVNAWKLPTEPFTFVVDRTGVIRDRFEGAFSTAELQKAVEKVAA
jgi:hypothetical protein